MKDMGCKCAHLSNWVSRIILALIFILQGYGKIAVMTVPAFSAAFNLPEPIGWLVALGELGAGIGILVGGFISKQDPKSYLTRASGAIIALIMLGAIFIAKWGGFADGFAAGIKGMHPDLALFALGFYFLAVGNATAECTMCKK